MDRSEWKSEDYKKEQRRTATWRVKFTPTQRRSSNPHCLVCGGPLVRNNPFQVVRYHAECRGKRVDLARAARDVTP